MSNRSTIPLNARRKRLQRSIHLGEETFREVRSIHNDLRKKLGEPAQLPVLKKIAIVGAGVAGMYAAYLLQKHCTDFEITIFESAGAVGGRINTKRFSADPYQYAEFGAMRIPDVHKTVLKLIGDLGLTTGNFIFENPSSTLFYANGTKNPTTGEIMTSKFANDNGRSLGFMPIYIVGTPRRHPVIPVDYSGITLLVKNPDDIPHYTSVAELYGRVFSELGTELEENPDFFFQDKDKYSVFSYFNLRIRQYLDAECVVEAPDDVTKEAKIQALIDSILHFGEMTSTATGLNHLALVESVLDSAHFVTGQAWHTVANGMDNLTNELAKRLTNVKINLNQRVVELRPANDIGRVFLRTDKDAGDYFSRVIVTAPFGAARLFIPPDAQFTYGKRQAIRSLNYDQSTKVIAQFDNRWWENIPNKQEGGVSTTDLSVRSVVYPSYGNFTPGKGVLLCSYTWQNDAVNMGNLSPEARKQIVIDNLNTLHATSGSNSVITGEVTMDTRVWSEAFALFAPGQFNLMVNGMIPELGVHFAGEHLSTSHAWIVGAMNSAVRSVREILVLEEILSDTQAWTEFHNPGFEDEEFTELTWLQYITNIKGQQS